MVHVVVRFHHREQIYIHMAKLSDIYSLVTKNSKASDIENFKTSKLSSSLSDLLGVDIMHAKWLLKHYGVNYIFVHTGLALPYSESNCKRCLKQYGAVVVVRENYQLSRISISRDDIKGKQNRRREIAQNIRAKRENERKDYNELKNGIRRERFFSSMQNRPCPKRGGRANSLSDLGKYIQSRPTSISCMVPSATYSNKYQLA